jgi:signal transduction histidine kinase
MFAVEIAGSLPELWADARVVRQIVLNLLSNAMKFTPSGGLVTLRCFESAIEGIVVEIEDTGIGISAAELPNLGKAFHQAERTLVRKHEGSGLGLALVQAFVGMHQGRLEISSQEGVGTKARVIFPASRIVRRADAEADAADSTMQASSEAAA